MGRVSDARERLMAAVLELIWTGSYGATTIDDICEKSGVKKGSFYYFFDSKADLAAAALKANSEAKRAEWDAMFSPSLPPLERIQRYCEFAYTKQMEVKKSCGCVLGCPLFTLGAEVSTQEQKLRVTINEMLEQHAKYLENAIREAHAQGVIDAPDPALKARAVRAYYEGLMTQARIQNDAEVLREMAKGVFAMLGVKTASTPA
jgi:TetR/AcrR family transcriptional regulator, transcriptional repressor for nem operon